MRSSNSVRRLSRARRIVFGSLRVLAVVGAALAVLLLYRLHTAKAEVEEASLAIGRELDGLADLLDETHALLLNGERLFLSNAITDESAHLVLDRIESHCRDGQGPFADLTRALAKGSGVAPSQRPSLLDGVLRSDDREEGSVLCFVKSKASEPSLFSALRSFERTSDLGKFGDLRYAFVRPLASGKTRILTMWTHGSLNFGHLVGEGLDEPQGTDSQLAPRPPDGRRVLSAAVEGTPYAVRVYETPTAPGPVESFFDGEMKARGWSLEGARTLERGEKVHVYMHESQQVLLTVAVNEGKTLVTIGEM